MAIQLVVRQANGAATTLTLDDGECMFVLGANGTGKSSLMHAFFTAHRSIARRISAHRQTWFASSALSLSPEEKRRAEQHILNLDSQADSRWKDDFSAQRANIAIYDLLDAENVRARRIAGAVDSSNIDLARALSKADAPIKIINELLRLSGMPIEITVRQNEQVMASKSGSAPYSVAELSDGERNALLIAANVLTVSPGTLLLIDEPERHLHRSIISPLLTSLFQKRPDCKFVVSTHDVLLPLDNPTARTLLIRSCTYHSPAAVYWDVDLVPANSTFDEEIKKDILGSRRKVLFVEGNGGSLDKPLYELTFPGVSVLPKGGCMEVEGVVAGIRAAPDLHWVNAFGVVDNDRRDAGDIARLKAQGIYVTAVYMIESIYYHPNIQRRLAERHAAITGGDATQMEVAAVAAGLAAVAAHARRLSARAIEKKVRAQIDAAHPTQAQIAAGAGVAITIDVAGELAAEQVAFEALVAAGDLAGIICRYPVRESPALTEIARRLGFQDRAQYESAVIKLLADDGATLDFVRGLFGTLYADIMA